MGEKIVLIPVINHSLPRRIDGRRDLVENWIHLVVDVRHGGDLRADSLQPPLARRCNMKMVTFLYDKWKVDCQYLNCHIYHLCHVSKNNGSLALVVLILISSLLLLDTFIHGPYFWCSTKGLILFPKIDEFCLRNVSDTHLGGMEALCPGSRDKKLIKSDPAFLPAVS